MKVIAIKPGVWIKYRNVDDVFDWPDQRPLPRWVRALEPDAKVQPKKRGRPEPVALSEFEAQQAGNTGKK